MVGLTNKWAAGVCAVCVYLSAREEERLRNVRLCVAHHPLQRGAALTVRSQVDVRAMLQQQLHRLHVRAAGRRQQRRLTTRCALVHVHPTQQEHLHGARVPTRRRQMQRRAPVLHARPAPAHESKVSQPCRTYDGMRSEGCVRSVCTSA